MKHGSICENKAEEMTAELVTLAADPPPLVPEPTRKPKRQYNRSGSRALRNTPARGDIDQRTEVRVLVNQWRADLIADLGGEDNLSAQKKALVEVAARSKLILDSI